jgi:hypothetical protein
VGRGEQGPFRRRSVSMAARSGRHHDGQRSCDRMLKMFHLCGLRRTNADGAACCTSLSRAFSAPHKFVVNAAALRIRTAPRSLNGCADRRGSEGRRRGIGRHGRRVHDAIDPSRAHVIVARRGSSGGRTAACASRQSAERAARACVVCELPVRAKVASKVYGRIDGWTEVSSLSPLSGSPSTCIFDLDASRSVASRRGDSAPQFTGAQLASVLQRAHHSRFTAHVSLLLDERCRYLART